MAAPARKGRGRKRPDEAATEKENDAELQREPDDLHTERRRSTRPITLTDHADPKLTRNLRPGNTRLREKVIDERASESDYEDNEASARDQAREAGEEDDDEYEVPDKPRQPRRTHQAMEQMGTQNGQPFRAITVTQTATALTGSRLSNLHGTVHSLPGDNVTSTSAPRSIIHGGYNFVVPPPGTSTDLVQPAQAAASPATAGCAVVNLQPPAKRHASSREEGGCSDTDAERIERRREKKRLHNAKRARYHDYTPNIDLFRVMRRAGNDLFVHFSTIMPFPSPGERETVVKEVFERTSRAQQHDVGWYTLSKEDHDLLAQEDSNVRSRVRKAAARLVHDHYKIEKTPSATVQVRNKDKVEHLLKDRFHCADVDAQAGRFQHEIIVAVIHEVWFSHATAVGCLYQDEFNPIPLPVIALVVTAVHHILSSWSTGKLVTKKFKTDVWPNYDDYLNAIKQFDRGPMQALWQRWRSRIFKRGLNNAGVLLEECREPITSVVSDEALQVEVRRLQELLGQESDEEM